MIELIVVMTILSFIMALIMPKGYKLLESFEKKMDIAAETQKLSNERAWAFLSVTQKEVTVDGVVYIISSKGVVSKK